MPKIITGAEYVISLTGGLTRTAAALTKRTGQRVPVTTVQGWKDRNRIPQERWMDLIDIATENSQTLQLGDFLIDHEVEEENAEAAA